MHTFLDKFQQGGRYPSQIDSNQAELRREELFVDQKPLSLSALKTDYLYLDNSVISTEGSNIYHPRCIHCGGS